jgi:peptide/nickel transport system substrate-binding protein
MAWFAMSAMGLANASAAQELAVALSGQSLVDDPHLSRTGADFQYFEHLFDTLVTREGFGVAPRLASAWSSSDSKVWSFRLRHNARFSNGRSVTATDVAYSLCRYETLARENGGAPLGLVSVEATGMADVTLRLESPYRLLPAALSLVFIVASPADGRGVGGTLGCDPAAALASLGRPQIGSGPYVTAASPAPKRRQLVASAYYGAEPPPWHSMLLINEPDARERLRLLLAGEVDIMEDVPPQQLPYLQRQPNIHLTELPTDRVLMLTFNMAATTRRGTPNPLANPQVRRAINMAIDRWALVERGMAGVAGPAWQLAQPGMEGWLPARAGSGKEGKADLAMARQLLVAAGYKDGFDTELIMPQSRVTDQPRVAELLAGMLRSINIRADIRPVDAAAVPDLIRQGDFSLLMSAIGLTAGSVMEGLEASAGPLFHGTSTNPSGFQDAALNGLLAQARGVEPGEIPALAEKAAQILDRDTPLIPLLHMRDLVAHRAGLTITAADTARAFGRITWPVTAHLAPSQP